MISMNNVESVAKAASYYAEDNYYTAEENTAQSAWQGEGAAALGLSGPVTPEQFIEVLSGHVGGRELGRIVGRDAETGELVRDHRPAFDVTLSAPKSVSLLAEVASRPDVRAAHEAAVDRVLAYIEQQLATTRVTEAGQTYRELTGKLVVARFHHTVSRALDPQTHTHLVIANATVGADGIWRSIDNHPIYRAQKLLGAIYDCELAANLRALGYRIEPREKGGWEIAGITREQIEHFSQRSQAIEARLEKFGLTRATATAAQREDAALRTRDSKAAFSREKQRQLWIDRAKETGIDFERIEAQRAQQADRSIDPADTRTSAAAAVRFALAHITERESVMTQPHLAEVALLHTIHTTPWSSVTLASVEEAISTAVEAGNAVQTDAGDLTTPTALAREESMLTLLEANRTSVVPITSAPDVKEQLQRFEVEKARAIGTPFMLTGGQADAAVLALTSRSRFVGLQGYAGTGKTTMLELVASVAAAQGYTVRGMSPSAEGARILQDGTGIASSTVARFLIDLEQAHRQETAPLRLDVAGQVDLHGGEVGSIHVKLPRTLESLSRVNDVWILDEASLAGQRQVSALMEAAARSGARLILVGDRLQLNAVESGKPFELLLRHGIPQTAMTDISRQQVQDLRDAVAASVQRDNLAALAHLQSRIVEVGDKGKLFDRIVGDIVSVPEQERQRSLLLVPLNRDRAAINERVRMELQNQGRIANEERTVQVLLKTDLTKAQRRFASYLPGGTVIRFTKDNRSLGIARNSYATVVSVSAASQTALLHTARGEQVSWKPRMNGHTEAYTAEERKIAVGDEIRFTRNNRELDVRNGTPGKVTGFDGEHILVGVGDRIVELNPSDRSHGHWDYAYAMTVYAAQGHTTGRANFLITQDSGRAMGERSFYVGITRPRADLRIYTDAASKTIKLIQQLQEKSSAIEGVAPGAERVQSGQPGRGISRSEGMEM